MNPALLLLFIALPLAGAAVSVLSRSRTLNLLLLLGIPTVVGAGGIWVMLLTRGGAVLAHSVGGYVDGLAIPFVADSFTGLMLVITSLAAVVCAWFLRLTGEDQYRFVPALILMMLTGVYGAFLTGDLFNLFVFVEVMVLPSYALIAVTGTWRRLGVGRMFVMVNLLTSTLLLIGVGFVYGAAGTVNIAVLATLTHTQGVSAQTAFAIALMLFALVIKAGAAPIHGWLVRSYPNTSAGMMALFAALHTKVAIYAIYRVYVSVFGGLPAWGWAFAILAMLTILVGAVSSFGERRVRNILAYQMTSGMGHLFLGGAILSVAAVSAGIFYLVHHIITMSGLLLTIGAVEQTYGTGSFKKLQGLIRREKWAAVLMILGLFSLVGLPPTSGLWGKMGLIRAVTADGSLMGWMLAGTVVAGSLITLLALQRMWRNTFWGEDMTMYHPDSPQTGRAPATELTAQVRVKPSLLLPGTVMIGISVALFVFGGALMPFVQEAGTGLLDVGPYVEAVIRR